MGRYGMSLIELAQLIGAIGVTIFYPVQNWRAVVSRNPVGLSFLGFSFIFVGVLGYSLLGMRLGTTIFAILNLICFAFATLLLVIMWRYSTTLSDIERGAGVCVMQAGTLVLLLSYAFFPDTAVTMSGLIGLVGIILFYPIQNARLFITKNTTGLSFAAFLSLYIGLCALTVFGALLQDMTIVLGNGLSALGTLAILVGIRRWKNHAKQSPGAPTEESAEAI